MLGPLLNNLSTLIVTVRRNVWSSFLTTFLILVIIVAWSARGNFATWLERNPTVSQKTERVVRGVRSDEKIEKALHQNLKILNADRVLIRRFSEQTNDATSAPIAYVSTTHIANGPGISMPTAQIINMPRSYISDVITVVFADKQKPVCGKFKTADIKDEIYHRLLVESGVYEQYICPIIDIDGEPLGLIIAGYLTDTKSRPTEEEIFTKLSDTATRVAGYLAEVTAPEKRTWYRLILDS